MTTGPGSDERMETIMRPFDGLAVAGDDLRLDLSPASLYFRLRDARAEARAEERLADNDPAVTGAGAAQWKIVEDLAVEALETRSKDLEIAAWLTESLTRRAGLAGLAEGARILANLVDGFWDDGLHPAEDPGEPGARLVAVGGLSGEDRDGSLLQPLRKIVLFEREDGSPVAFWEYERSREFVTVGSTGQKPRAMTNVASFSDLEISARGHGRPALVSLRAETAAALAAWGELEATVARVASGDAAPATGRVRGVLDKMLRTAERYVPETELQAAAPAGSDIGTDAPIHTSGTADISRGIQSRDAMLDLVLQIASTFRQNEPNSPFSYTLEDAVRRARLSWPELLREVIPDHAPWAGVLSGLGIRPPSD